jgi:hypothetical protein
VIIVAGRSIARSLAGLEDRHGAARLAAVTLTHRPPAPSVRFGAPLRAWRRAHAAWGLALAAALVLALVPTLSRVLPGGMQAAVWTDGWAQVCTPQGLQDVPGEGMPASTLHGQACVLCVLAATLAPPPALAVALPRPAAEPGAAARPAPAPERRRGWRAAAPRGPPSLG